MANGRLVLLSGRPQRMGGRTTGRQRAVARACDAPPLPDWSVGEFWQQDERYE